MILHRDAIVASVKTFFHDAFQTTSFRPWKACLVVDLYVNSNIVNTCPEKHYDTMLSLTEPLLEHG